MAKLRHIAMVVDDMKKTAAFYEQAFGMNRVRESEVAIMLSDGTVSLAIIHSQNVNAEGREGLHHIGFLIDDMEAAASKVEQSGGTYYGQIRNAGGGPKSERKFCDPNGLHFDIATAEHAHRVWCIPGR